MNSTCKSPVPLSLSLLSRVVPLSFLGQHHQIFAKKRVGKTVALFMYILLVTGSYATVKTRAEIGVLEDSISDSQVANGMGLS